MALILKDRVKESSTSSGTGSITLGGAFPGYQTFNAAITTGSTVYYTIHNLTAGSDTEWEVGVGTFTSPSTLARNTVLSSSNSGSLVPFTSGVSGLEVFVTQPAEQALYTNQATGIVESSGNGANTIAFTNINASNVVTVSGTISTNAANATDITNKQYVDGLFSTGISYHDPVLVEEDVALNAVYVQPNGAGNGVGATLTNNGSNVALVIDGVSVSNTARILVYAQANAVQNGVYTVTNPGNATAQWVLTRATDADTFGLASPNKLGQGDAFFVQDGDTGAGRTYICNTTGTITFGSTNITFAQISSAQIYAAGTGLNLANLTFSISNTAVTAAQYGNDGAVGQFTVNAQGQLTNAANVSINASSISVGTLANGRTTAASANGASTIVLRDSNGDFAANTITATTSNATTFNGTTGAFTNVSGNGVALTAINASNVTSGTLDNARTTGSSSNSASTLVLRDSNGAFEAGNVTASNFIGAGTAITSINASNISSGTIDNARTTAASANGASTIVLRDSNGDFAANTISASFSGNGVAITAINASNISTGTIDNARTTASSSNGASTIVLRDVNGSFDANVVNATNLSGGGTSITSMNASNLSAGTVPVARVSGSYTGITGVGTVTAGTWQGNVIATTYGGTNLSSFTANGVVYASSTTALATGSGFVYDGSNVGVGVTPSAWTAYKSIEVGAVGSGIAATTSGTQLNAGYYYNSADKFAITGNYAMYSSAVSSDGSFRWYLSTATGTAGNNATMSERMRIDSSGNVLVGTTTALQSGSNRGNITIGGSASSVLNLGTGATTSSYLFHTQTGNELYLVNAANGPAIFYTNNTERMRLSAAGGFSVGTTSDPGAGAIYATGNITAFFSDERLKTVSGKIENALDKVNSLSGVYYTMNDVAKSHGYDSDETQVGVLAQEVEAVLPEIVKPAPFDLDENNNSKSGENYKTVQYEKLVPLLIEAIKELKAEVDALKGK